MKKRVLSLFLSLCLLLCLPPVRAAGEEEPRPPCAEGCSLEEGHEGECVLHETRYKTEAAGEWVYGSLADACANVYAGGRVEALRDMELEAGVTAGKAMTLTSADRSAPRTITYSPKDRSDYLLTADARDNNRITLTSIVLDGGREKGRASQSELVGVKSGQFAMISGAVIQNNDNVDTVGKGAGGLRVINGMAYVVTGASIRGCRGLLGGGAALAGRGATLVVNGGVIEDCEAFLGGGVFLHNNSPQSSGDLCRLYLQDGGAIRNNRAAETMEGIPCPDSITPGCGGGVYVERGVITIPYRNSGGAVEENSAAWEGGGIYALNGTLNLYSGAVTGNRSKQHGGGITAISPMVTVALGDTVRVTGNVSGDPCCDNLYLDIMRGISEDPTRPAWILMPLKGSVGVSRQVQPDEEHPYRVVAEPNTGPFGMYAITESDLEKFYSDDPRYVTMLHEGKIVLTNADVVFDTQGHGDTPPGQRIDEAHHYKVEEPEEPKARGYAFGGWYRDAGLSEESKWNFDDAITETDGRPKPLMTLYAKWTPIDFQITYILNDEEESRAENDNPVTYNIESEIILKEPVRKGYTFLGWTWDGQEEPRIEAAIPADSIGNREFTAHWEQAAPPTPPALPSNPDPGSEPDGEKPPYLPPELESRDHFAYIVGYPDGKVRPEACISRAEAASIFFRLMTDGFRESNWAEESPFPDVKPDAWYRTAVSTCARAGLIFGFPDGTFGGEKSITRAEFAAIAARFLSEETAPDSGFSDLGDHWAREEVDRAVAAGWIKGFPDGSFRPEALITRAEVVALVNRMVGRRASPEGMLEGMITWPDNPASAWYYADVQEAANGHAYDRDGEYGPETWTALK